MTIIYLHIGLNKAGSTSLQNFLADNRDLLLSMGYLYPKPGATATNHTAHPNLAWSIPDRFQRYDNRYNPKLGSWEDLLGEVDRTGVNQVIVSSEFFITFNEGRITQLKLKLKEYDQIKIVVYLRRQDKRIESQYKQGVKRNGLASDIYSSLENLKKTSDYYKFLRLWSSVFGLTNIVVKNFDQLTYDQASLYYDFLHTVGIERVDDFKIVNSKNISPGYKVIEVFRYLNELFIEKLGLSEEDCFNKYKLPILKAHFQNKILVDDQKYSLLSYPSILSIWNEFEESNRKVAQEYLGLENDTLFSPPDPSSENKTFHIDNLTSSEWQQIMATIFTKIEGQNI